MRSHIFRIQLDVNNICNYDFEVTLPQKFTWKMHLKLPVYPAGSTSSMVKKVDWKNCVVPVHHVHFLTAELKRGVEGAWPRDTTHDLTVQDKIKDPLLRTPANRSGYAKWKECISSSFMWHLFHQSLETRWHAIPRPEPFEDLVTGRTTLNSPSAPNSSESIPIPHLL